MVWRVYSPNDLMFKKYQRQQWECTTNGVLILPTCLKKVCLGKRSTKTRAPSKHSTDPPHRPRPVDLVQSAVHTFQCAQGTWCSERWGLLPLVVSSASQAVFSNCHVGQGPGRVTKAPRVEALGHGARFLGFHFSPKQSTRRLPILRPAQPLNRELHNDCLDHVLLIEGSLFTGGMKGNQQESQNVCRVTYFDKLGMSYPALARDLLQQTRLVPLKLHSSGHSQVGDTT